MASFIANNGLGRIAELAKRINQNDPTNSAFIFAAFVASGATDATIRDLDTLAACEAATSLAEATNSGYTRVVLDDTDITSFGPDDTNDRVDIDVADFTFSAVSAGDVWTDLGLFYDSDTTAGTDSNIELLAWYDFAVTPNGGDITAQVATGGFFRATSST